MIGLFFFVCTALEAAKHTVKLNVGESYTIKLFATPSAGYHWYLDEQSPAANSPAPLLKKTFLNQIQSNANGERKVGTPGHDAFTFQAEKLGKVTYTFLYKRGWETDVLDTEVYTFIVS
ncbi:hypothetical protein BLNAU_6418 [Blattamonas nauphoetae]|uniref:Proteinase inhibitor I42 chagasin domain-containing protein n=1 Tax=Blattamonas nauphoetae TaxID=2049346 RepID=A0ABQ9Y4K8_9EUKA|nr:hypothetical protein BLNAU_6418 [Blattamonas nauphoetae]